MYYSALIPIFSIILLGYIFKRQGFLNIHFWQPMEAITYFVLLPSLLVHDLANAPRQNVPLADISIALFSSMAIVSLLLLLMFPLMKKTSGAAFTSLYQGSIRFNSYIGMAIAHALNPQSGVMFSALAMAIMIPVVNVLCVIVLEHYATHTPTCWIKIFKSLLKNPLIISCLMGISINILQIPLPNEVQQTLKILGNASLPFGLLAVGAGLQFSTLHQHVGHILLSSLLKLGLMPFLVWQICVHFEINVILQQIIVLFAALPTATSSYILARQMGGDAVLMAGIITLETLLSSITLPIVLIYLT
jgi:predicted permease